jgi:hypothetical protein
VEIEVTRPFRKEDRKARFRATYRITDVPSPGCVQVTVTLATRIQLSQQILAEGYKYSDTLLGECVKELVKDYVDYGDFDQLLEAAGKVSEKID